MGPLSISPYTETGRFHTNSFQRNYTTLTDFSHFKDIWVLAWTRKTFRTSSLFFKPSTWNILHLDWNNLYRSRNDFVSKRPLYNPMAIQAFRRSLIGTRGTTGSSAPSETHLLRFIELSRRIRGWSWVICFKWQTIMRENICSEDDLRSRIFGTFVVKFLACLPLLGFSTIYKMV